jgi:hypothetical protein
MIGFVRPIHFFVAGMVACLGTFAGAVHAYEVVPGARWPADDQTGEIHVTFSYSNLLDGQLGGGVDLLDLRAATEEALALWAQYVPLNFHEVSDTGPAPGSSPYSAYLDYAEGIRHPDIRIGHLELTGGVVARAWTPTSYYQGLCGDVHFDTSRNWTTGPGAGMDLLQVMVHELGHTLGLDDETSSTTAIMDLMYTRRYSGLGTSFLFDDDIAGVQSIYGPGVGSVNTILLGDVDDDGTLSTVDIDQLYMLFGEPRTEPRTDLNYDGLVNQADVDMLVLRLLGIDYGDANGDKWIDEADLAMLAHHWKQPGRACWSDGDFSGDQIVSEADLAYLADNWGRTTAGAVALPEPVAVMLFSLALPWARRRG